MILRQRDANSGWTSAADATMEERRYYCQNWRGDFAAMLTSGGAMVESAKFSADGVEPATNVPVPYSSRELPWYIAPTSTPKNEFYVSF